MAHKVVKFGVLTKENFDLLEEGMSYEEVTEIIGEKVFLCQSMVFQIAIIIPLRTFTLAQMTIQMQA